MVFCLSILPSGSFHGIGPLVFSETQHGVSDPCGVLRDSLIFGENGENGPKIVFWVYWKI